MTLTHLFCLQAAILTCWQLIRWWNDYMKRDFGKLYSFLNIPLDVYETLWQGCLVFTTKPTQFSPKLAQSRFEGGRPLKIAFRGIIFFFWWGAPGIIRIPGAVVTSTRGNSVKVAQFCEKLRTWQHCNLTLHLKQRQNAFFISKVKKK